jgi:hypothetical protein
MELHLQLHNGDQADAVLEGTEGTVVFSHAQENTSLDTIPIEYGDILPNGAGFGMRKMNVLEVTLLNTVIKLQADLNKVMAVKLEPGEPFFVLKARDPQAPELILKWIKDRECVDKNFEKKASALAQMNAMIKWKAENPNFGLPAEQYHGSHPISYTLSHDTVCYEKGAHYGIPYNQIKFLQFNNGELVQAGTTNEPLLVVLLDRIKMLDEKFPCAENKEALHHIEKALEALDRRTALRQSQGIVGTNIQHISV